MSQITIRPHPGLQTRMQQTAADLTICGARAGVGKTWGLLLLPTLFLHHKIAANAIIFKARASDLTEEGGIVTKARRIYKPLGARHRKRAPTDFLWDLDGERSLSVTLAALHEHGDEEQYQGTDFGLIGWDELTQWHARPHQFEYLSFSRLRQDEGLPYDPLVVATCNPIADGWIRDLVDWWIGEDGLPIRARDGELRWFIRAPADSPTLYVVDSLEGIRSRFPHDKPSSITFLPGRPEDNPSLNWDKYQQSLAHLEPHLRAALDEGNWNARPPDDAKVYRLPNEALFRDLDDDFIEALGKRMDLFGGWDYGRALHGLAWVCGALQPGSPPTLWIIGCLTWSRSDPATAAEDRSRFLESLDLPIRVGEIQDAGDPSGRAINAGTSWHRELGGYGVPLLSLSHMYGEDKSKVYWNSGDGRPMILNLVQNWLNSGRLRIRQHSSTAFLIKALREWRLRVPEGMAPNDRDIDILVPRKDAYSHPCDALGYLVAFALAMIQADGAETTSSPSNQVIAHSEAMQAARLMGSRPPPEI